MSPTSTVEKSVVSAVVETLEKLYGEPLKQLDSLIKATGLPVYRDPRSGALLWVDVRELRLRFTLSVNKLEKFVEGMQQGRLMYTQCKMGGCKHFPPQVDCLTRRRMWSGARQAQRAS